MGWNSTGLNIFEQEPALQFIFFGGKGGVGKTTMSAAFGIAAAKRWKKRTLVISTDPAHSLSDSFDQQLSGEPTAINGVPDLFALELDTTQTIEEFADSLLNSPDPMISTVVAQFLGEDASILNAAPPGSDEAVAFLKVLEFIEKPTHDLVIFDTAPTGHTLRLLNLPEVLDSWLWRILSLRSRFSSLIGGFRHIFGGRDGSFDEKKAVDQIEELRDRVVSSREILADPTVTEFIPVTIPENMAIYETERLIRALHEAKIPTRNLVVNDIMSDNPSCRFCSSRYAMQMKNIAKIHDFFPDFHLAEVPLFETEVRGRELLERLSDLLLQ
jgi:arsenite-transporting ATPase